MAAKKRKNHKKNFVDEAQRSSLVDETLFVIFAPLCGHLNSRVNCRFPIFHFGFRRTTRELHRRFNLFVDETQNRRVFFV